MIKKCNKILFTLIFALLLLITTVNAQELTVAELTEKVKAIEPDASYLYIIGEYVFTSEHILTTQDTMLAARTIDVTSAENAYDEMTIAYLEGIYDSDWNLVGFEYISNAVGKAPEKQKYDVKYLDHKLMSEEIKELTTSTLVNEAYNTIDTTSANDKFEVAINGNAITVTVLDTTMNSVTALQGTGVATAAKNLLNAEGVKSVVLKVAGQEPLEITSENLSTPENLEALDNLFTALAGTGTAGNLAGKTLEVKINAKAGYTAVGDTTFTVTFDN